MNLGELKAQFSAILNRRDITPSLVTTFIQQSIQRIQRELRTPMQEKVVLYEWRADRNGIPLPNDYIRLISIDTATDSSEPGQLRGADLNTVLRRSIEVGRPELYCRQDAEFLVAPRPVVGTQLFITYIADFSAINADTDVNILTNVAADAVIYGALSYASDYYLDDRRVVFEERFVQILNSLQGQADDDELIAARIAPAVNLDMGY